ncbi:MAG TPA: hypothetical protein VGC57_15975 [Cellulomonas sp.]
MDRWMRRRLDAARREPDAGMSVVMVLTSFTLLFALVLVTSLYVTRSIGSTSSYVNSEKALAAAESGITDFIGRASATPGYWETVDCENIAMQEPTPAGTTSACADWSATTEVGWAPVEPGGTDDASNPSYHYEVIEWDARSGSQAASVVIQVTGRAGDSRRTLQVELRRDSTEQYAGYQNHWLTSTCTGASGDRLYQWSEESWVGADSTRCVGLWAIRNGTNKTGWTGGNSSAYSNWGLNPWVNPVGGDFFSNDAGFISPASSMGSTYEVDGTLTVSNPKCTLSGWSSSFATWASGPFSADCGTLPGDALAKSGTFSTVSVTEVPEQSSRRTLPYDTSTLVDAPGCRYYGPTRIVLLGNGKMRVWSTQSIYDGLALAVPSADGSTTPDCGTAQKLGSPEGADVVVPDGMVVYVTDVPAGVVTKNSVVNGRLEPGEIGGDAEHGWLPAGEDPVALGVGADWTPVARDSQSSWASYYRTEGNLWLEGALDGGQVTLASEGAVSITGDVVTTGSTGSNTDNLLGIIASQVVVVDQRVALNPLVRFVGGELVTAVGYGSVYTYRGGVDGSGSMGAWPHDYDQNADQVRIDAAIQVLDGGLQYWNADVCLLSWDGWAGSSADKEWARTFPGAEGLDLRTTVVPDRTDDLLEVVVHGSLAQNYLGSTGLRREEEGLVGFQGTYLGGIRTVTLPAGSCGADVTVEYDDRLQSAIPPYLLRFTDLAWQATGDTTEVSTPDRLR